MNHPIRGDGSAAGWTYPSRYATKMHYFPAGTFRSACGEHVLSRVRNDRVSAQPDDDRLCRTCKRHI